MSKARVAVLISGRGSNMAALIEAAKDPAYPAEIVLVLSNIADAGGLDIAQAAGIDARLRQSGVQIVALAGYMRVLTPYLVETWAGRMINIHPSLLPAFPGLHTHQRALEAGVAKHGCTVHLVTTGVDEGPILGQAEVDVLPDDDEDRLGARVLEQEHQLYTRCLADLVRGVNGSNEIR
jgi:folate-dependent phosphoribosylglycinamide formyltransferase PurN